MGVPDSLVKPCQSCGTTLTVLGTAVVTVMLAIGSASAPAFAPDALAPAALGEVSHSWLKGDPVANSPPLISSGSEGDKPWRARFFW